MYLTSRNMTSWECFNGLFFLIICSSTVSGEIYMNSTCDSNDGFLGLEEGESCTFYCEALNYAKDERLYTYKQIYYYTVKGYVRPVLSFDVYETDVFLRGDFVSDVKDSGRYTIDFKNESIVQFTFTDAHVADTGRYYCRTELDGSIIDQPEPEMARRINVKGFDMDLKFAKKSADDSEIFEVYENDTLIEVDATEYKNLVLLMEVKKLVIFQFNCSIFATTDNGMEELTRSYTNPDLETYMPRNALPVDSHYTDMMENFQVPDSEEFTLEAICEYDLLDDVQHHSGKLQVRYKNAANVLTSSALVALSAVYVMHSNFMPF